MPADESIRPLNSWVGERRCFGPASMRAASTPTSPRFRPKRPNDSSWILAMCKLSREMRAVTSNGSISRAERVAARRLNSTSVQSGWAT